mmetsp:Transcript_8229/g.23128  ORF Transcript_8229/g.23128 Transcript_8229/m.23128 type:complete len:360 (-) Transcript_8229:444-1523(-)
MVWLSLAIRGRHPKLILICRVVDDREITWSMPGACLLLRLKGALLTSFAVGSAAVKLPRTDILAAWPIQSLKVSIRGLGVREIAICKGRRRSLEFLETIGVRGCRRPSLVYILRVSIVRARVHCRVVLKVAILAPLAGIVRTCDRLLPQAPSPLPCLPASVSRLDLHGRPHAVCWRSGEGLCGGAARRRRLGRIGLWAAVRILPGEAACVGFLGRARLSWRDLTAELRSGGRPWRRGHSVASLGLPLRWLRSGGQLAADRVCSLLRRDWCADPGSLWNGREVVLCAELPASRHRLKILQEKLLACGHRHLRLSKLPQARGQLRAVAGACLWRALPKDVLQVLQPLIEHVLRPPAEARCL